MNDAIFTETEKITTNERKNKKGFKIDKLEDDVGQRFAIFSFNVYIMELCVQVCMCALNPRRNIGKKNNERERKTSSSRLTPSGVSEAGERQGMERLNIIEKQWAHLLLCHIRIIAKKTVKINETNSDLVI